MAPNKILLVKQLVEAAKNNLDTATQLLRDLGAQDTEVPGVKPHVGGTVQHTDQGAVIIEGVFDGQNMVGPDGKLYSVPANYASKSKLVEGDLLKLTISPDGSFIYKQIGPVERERIIGVLTRDDQSDEFKILAKGTFYKILLASITYFKASLGDEVVILVPKGTVSTWAAVENVVKKPDGSEGATGVIEEVSLSLDEPKTISSTDTAISPRPRGRPPKTAKITPTEDPTPAPELTKIEL